MAAYRWAPVVSRLQPIYIYMIFQIWNLAAASTGALLVNRVGRRTLFIISNAGMLMGQCLRRIGCDGVLTLLRAAFSVLALSSSLFYSGVVAGGHGLLRLTSDRICS